MIMRVYPPKPGDIKQNMDPVIVKLNTYKSDYTIFRIQEENKRLKRELAKLESAFMRLEQMYDELNDGTDSMQQSVHLMAAQNSAYRREIKRLQRSKQQLQWDLLEARQEAETYSAMVAALRQCRCNRGVYDNQIRQQQNYHLRSEFDTDDEEDQKQHTFAFNCFFATKPNQPDPMPEAKKCTRKIEYPVAWSSKLSRYSDYSKLRKVDKCVGTSGYGAREPAILNESIRDDKKSVDGYLSTGKCDTESSESVHSNQSIPTAQLPSKPGNGYISTTKWEPAKNELVMTKLEIDGYHSPAEQNEGNSDLNEIKIDPEYSDELNRIQGTSKGTKAKHAWPADEELGDSDDFDLIIEEKMKKFREVVDQGQDEKDTQSEPIRKQETTKVEELSSKDDRSEDSEDLDLIIEEKMREFRKVMDESQDGKMATSAQKKEDLQDLDDDEWSSFVP